MPATLVDELKDNFSRIILLGYQPTSELMVADFAERIQKLLPKNIELKHLLLRETVTSYAEWYADENLD
jgi:6-pyruvoyltetrahydropterin/6-carboxytetrahydropterin synthase